MLVRTSSAFLLMIAAFAAPGHAAEDISALSDEALLAELSALETEAEQIAAAPVPDAPFGHLGAFLGYDSYGGATAGLRLNFNDFLTEGQKLSLSGELQREGEALEFGLRNRTLIPGVAESALEFSHMRRRADDLYDFAVRAQRLRAGLAWDLSPGLRLSAFGQLAREELSEPGSGLSPLVARDMGQRDRRALGYEMRYTTPSEGLRFSASLSQEFGRSSGGRSYGRTIVALDSAGPAMGGFEWGAGLRAGLLRSRSGPSHVGDRFFVGNSVLRGFSPGGFGPRDLSVASQTALGGERYASLRLDLQKPGAFGLPDSFRIGAFADAGALWKAPGALPGQDGTSLRSAAGLTASLSLSKAVITLELAHPLKKQSYDRSRTLNVRLTSNF